MVLVDDTSSTIVETVVEILCEISAGHAHGLELVQKPNTTINNVMKIELVFVFIFFLCEKARRYYLGRNEQKRSSFLNSFLLLTMYFMPSDLVSRVCGSMVILAGALWASIPEEKSNIVKMKTVSSIMTIIIWFRS